VDQNVVQNFHLMFTRFTEVGRKMKLESKFLIQFQIISYDSGSHSSPFPSRLFLLRVSDEDFRLELIGRFTNVPINLSVYSPYIYAQEVVDNADSFYCYYFKKPGSQCDYYIATFVDDTSDDNISDEEKGCQFVMVSCSTPYLKTKTFAQCGDITMAMNRVKKRQSNYH
jgi:hypothetical protein